MNTPAFADTLGIPVRTDDDTINSFGGRVLLFLLSHDYSLGFFDTDGLHAAHYAVQRALQQRVVLGPKDAPESSPACVYDRLEEIRRQVTTSLTRRAKELDEALQALADSVPPKGSDKRGSSRVLVSDINPKPKLPPAGAFAEVVADPF